MDNNKNRFGPKRSEECLGIWHPFCDCKDCNADRPHYLISASGGGSGFFAQAGMFGGLIGREAGYPVVSHINGCSAGCLIMVSARWLIGDPPSGWHDKDGYPTSEESPGSEPYGLAAIQWEIKNHKDETTRKWLLDWLNEYDRLRNEFDASSPKYYPQIAVHFAKLTAPAMADLGSPFAITGWSDNNIWNLTRILFTTGANDTVKQFAPPMRLLPPLFSNEHYGDAWGNVSMTSTAFDLYAGTSVYFCNDVKDVDVDELRPLLSALYYDCSGIRTGTPTRTIDVVVAASAIPGLMKTLEFDYVEGNRLIQHRLKDVSERVRPTELVDDGVVNVVPVNITEAGYGHPEVSGVHNLIAESWMAGVNNYYTSILSTTANGMSLQDALTNHVKGNIGDRPPWYKRTIIHKFMKLFSGILSFNIIDTMVTKVEAQNRAMAFYPSMLEKILPKVKDQFPWWDGTFPGSTQLSKGWVEYKGHLWWKKPVNNLTEPLVWYGYYTSLELLNRAKEK